MTLSRVTWVSPPVADAGAGSPPLFSGDLCAGLCPELWGPGAGRLWKLAQAFVPCVGFLGRAYSQGCCLSPATCEHPVLPAGLCRSWKSAPQPVPPQPGALLGRRLDQHA